ncbi:MAG: GNAT family N-acetyltransferase [Ruminococcus sp.]|nr:GNAT family N-acetyltransferase [Ruminococcus sp.]
MTGKHGRYASSAQIKIFRTRGAGSLVFKAAMDFARVHGAKRLFIISNSRLKPALHIYKKFGFKATPHDHCTSDAQSDFSSDCPNLPQ